MKKRRLLLMRHAKSDWADQSLSDHDRPLNKRGRRDAPRVADWIRQLGDLPSLILCSSAMRTRQTAELLTETWSGGAAENVAIRATDSLYLAAAETIFNVICTAHDDAAGLLVIGHNPGMAALVAGLTGQHRDMPTAAVAVFDVDVDDWTDLRGPDQVSLVDQVRAKEIA